MSAENKAIVRRLYEEVWNKRKIELVGPEAYKRQLMLFLAGYSDLHFTIEDTIAENDKVVACWTFSGTHRGDYLGIPATNKRVSVDGITIHHIANGKIMDSYSNWDALGMMQQLGVIPAPGQAKSLTAR
jgi:steroid delta-isomerase-like uncharacterized protein